MGEEASLLLSYYGGSGKVGINSTSNEEHEESGMAIHEGNTTVIAGVQRVAFFMKGNEGGVVPGGWDFMGKEDVVKEGK